MPSNLQRVKARAALFQNLETRRLFAIVSVANVEGYARAITASDHYAFYSEVESYDSFPQRSIGIHRVDLKTGVVDNVRPGKGKVWAIRQEEVELQAAPDGVWIMLPDSGQVWKSSDATGRATPIFSTAEGSQYTGTFVTSPDHSHAYFAIANDSFDYRWYVSDGTKAGTRLLLSTTFQSRLSATPTANGMLLSGQDDSTFEMRSFYVANDAPLTPVEVTSKLPLTIDMDRFTVASAPDGRTLIHTDDDTFFVDASFQKITKLKVTGIEGDYRFVKDAAPIDGGIAYLVTDNSSTEELWVSQADGTKPRRVAQYEVALGNEKYTPHLLPVGSLFALARVSDSISESDQPVPRGAITSQGLYSLSFKDGLKLIANVSVDHSFRLSGGRLVAAASDDDGQIIDITHATRPRVFGINALGATSNGDAIIFEDTKSGHHVLAFDPAVTGALVRGNVAIDRVGGKAGPAPSTIGVTRPSVYADLNNDGKRQSTEPSAPLDAENNYLLTRVPANRKTAIRVDADSVAFATVTTAAKVRAAEDTLSKRSFTLEYRPADIEVTVYNDRDSDGVRDAAEPGAKGVRVTLIRDYASTDTQSTNTVGRTLFTNVTPGLYDEIGLRETSEWKRQNATAHSITARPGQTVRIRLPMIHFSKIGSISVRPFRDRNNDGRRRAGEPLLPPGQPLDIVNETTSTSAGRAVTDANGVATFTGLPAGEYGVYFDEDVLKNPNGDPAYISVRPNIALGDDQHVSFDLAAFVTPMITGVAFNDSNKNGVRDAGETPIVDAIVGINAAALTLPAVQGAITFADNYAMSVHTDAQGRYALHVPSGFDIDVMSLYGWTVSGDTFFAGRAFNPRSGTDLVIDVPFVRDTTHASVTIRGFMDQDADGVRDADEPLTGFSSDLQQTNVTVLDANNNAVIQGVPLTGIATIFYGLSAGHYRFKFQPWWDGISAHFSTHDYVNGFGFDVTAGESKVIIIGGAY